MSGDLESLRAEVERTRRAHQKATRRLNEALIALSPLQVGDVVEVTDRGQARVGIVRAVSHWWDDFYTYEVSWRRKDGEWSKSVNRAYGTIRKLDEGQDQ